MFYLILFLNFWIYKLLSLDFLVGVTAIAASFALYKNKKLFIPIFILLLFLQFQTTNKINLTSSTSLQNDTQIKRMRYYPFFNLPVAYYLEQKPVALAFYRMQNNLSEVLDINLYFFANHPRNRPGVNEFEKFHFIFLPFFVVGLVKTLPRKNKYYYFSFLAPVILIMLIGNQNSLSAFSLFPFFIITIHEAFK